MGAEQSNEQQKRLELLLEINREITSTIALEELLHRIVEAVIELTDSESSALMLYDEQDQVLRFTAATVFKDELINVPVPLEGSIAGAAYLSGEPVVVNDVASDPRHFKEADDVTGLQSKSLLAVPLMNKNRKVGVLEAENKHGGRPYDQHDVDTLLTLAAQATIAIVNGGMYWKMQRDLAERERIESELAETESELKNLLQQRDIEMEAAQAEIVRLTAAYQQEAEARQKAEEELRRMATTDPVTGTYNRRQFFILAEQAFQQARRYGNPFSLLTIDIDHFKQINEGYGPGVGDTVLRRLAGFLQTNLRSSDTLARYEGDQFAILLPETGLDMAAQAADRLMEGVRLLVVAGDAKPINITISVGVTALNHNLDQSLQAMLARAEEAVIEAKLAGRDRVVVRR